MIGLDGSLSFTPNRVRTGKLITRRYQIYRDTQQGCPLLPLLFTLAVEPLAATMREEGRDWGIPLHDDVHIISLYADDLCHTYTLGMA